MLRKPFLLSNLPKSMGSLKGPSVDRRKLEDTTIDCNSVNVTGNQYPHDVSSKSPPAAADNLQGGVHHDLSRSDVSIKVYENEEQDHPTLTKRADNENNVTSQHPPPTPPKHAWIDVKDGQCFTKQANECDKVIEQFPTSTSIKVNGHGKVDNINDGNSAAICALLVVLFLITLTSFGMGALAALSYTEVLKLQEQNQDLRDELSSLEDRLPGTMPDHNEVLHEINTAIAEDFAILRNELLDTINLALTEVSLMYGTVYTRWGNASCPASNTSTLYNGLMVGSNSSDSGYSSTHLCLPPEPNYAVSNPQVSSHITQIVGFDSSIVPCAVCFVSGRSRTVMIPAKTICPDGWTREYYGYIMSHRHSTEFLCVDNSKEDTDVLGESGSGLYHVGVDCEWLHAHCPLYEEEQRLTCVVCTK